MKNDSGFTLFEALVSIAIAGIGLSILMAVFTGGGFLFNNRAQERAEAYAAKMNQIDPQNNYAIINCNFDTDGDGYGSCNFAKTNKQSGEVQQFTQICASGMFSDGCYDRKPYSFQ